MLRKSSREEGSSLREEFLLFCFLLSSHFYYFCNDIFDSVFNEFYGVRSLYYRIEFLSRIPMDFICNT